MACKLTDIRLEPCGDFALNSFLLKINDELTDDDLRRLKFLCQGKICTILQEKLLRCSLFKKCNRLTLLFIFYFIREVWN